MDQYDVNKLEVVSLRSVGKSVLVVSEKGLSKVRRGILRFFGTVEFASGQFCGIELDTPQGKHNGSFKGIRYFQCAPEHGIFVPAEKVYNDPKSCVSKPKILTSSPSVNTNKSKFKKAQSDAHAYIGSASPRLKDPTTADEQNFNDTNLFQILGSVSSDDLKQTKKSPKFILPPKISPKTMNSILIRPSSTSFSQPPPIVEKKTTEIPVVLDARNKRPVLNRPRSVASTNSKNTLAIQLAPTQKKSLPLVRHRSLTENDFKNVSQLIVKTEIPTFVTKVKPITQVEMPDLSLEFPDKQERTKTKESISARPSSLYEQQDTLAQSKIPEIPHCYDISVELNTFFESNQKFIKEANNAREIMQFIDRDKTEWDNKMDILQERFRKLSEDVEVLCYQHLEALSHLPSQTNEANLENSNQETLFSQNSH